jgi:hypothetical protein
VKSSKAQTHANFHKVPALRFDEQELTLFSGLVVFQALFDRLWLKLRRRFIQHAGRLIRPQGKLTLSMTPNHKVQQDIVQYLSALQQVA